jgi:hypothetical protein
MVGEDGSCRCARGGCRPLLADIGGVPPSFFLLLYSPPSLYLPTCLHQKAGRSHNVSNARNQSRRRLEARQDICLRLDMLDDHNYYQDVA